MKDKILNGLTICGQFAILCIVAVIFGFIVIGLAELAEIILK